MHLFKLKSGFWFGVIYLVFTLDKLFFFFLSKMVQEVQVLKMEHSGMN